MRAPGRVRYDGRSPIRSHIMDLSPSRYDLAKVPAVTLGFWIIKILATTLGETAGDAVTMSMELGYLAGTAIFAALLTVVLTAQIRAQRFNPLLFWTVIVATT